MPESKVLIPPAPRQPGERTHPVEMDVAEVCIARPTNPDGLNILSLVLSAADITHRVNYISSKSMEIYVSSRDKEKADREITAYLSENRNWPPQATPPETTIIFRAMSPLVVGLLLLFYNVTGGWQAESLWFAAGAGDSQKILFAGEIYRLVTALTLHADLVHLLSNCFLGALLLHYFLQLTGNGIGLFSMLFTGALANYLNVLAHGPGHHFVGFSTAIFSVIGMLCTIGFAAKTMRYILHFLMPIMGGLALLALLGSSGERTDLGAHLFGLLCGLVFGNVVRLPLFPILRHSIPLQIALSLFSFLLVIFAWYFALH